MNLPDVLSNKEYRELYPIEERNMSVLIHEPTQKLYLCKQRKNYDIRVYEYLKDHPHPNISSIQFYFEKDDILIVLEEYIEGKTLKEFLRDRCISENTPLPGNDSLKHNSYENTLSDDTADILNTSQRLKILDAVCDGLSFLHHADPPIIHRDLKASNIILTKDGEIKLIDYDAAKTYKKQHSEDTVHIGTPGIAAPEQYGFAQSDARTDIYALGKLTEQLFGTDLKYTELIQKATEIDPRNRYQTVEEFRSALHGTPIIAHTGKIKRYIPMVLLLLLIPIAWFLGRGSRGKLDNSTPDNMQSTSDSISYNDLNNSISDNDPAEKSDLIAETAPDDNDPDTDPENQTTAVNSTNNDSSGDDTNNSEFSDDKEDDSGQSDNDDENTSNTENKEDNNSLNNDSDNSFETTDHTTDDNSVSPENNSNPAGNGGTETNSADPTNTNPAGADPTNNGTQPDTYNASILTPEEVAAISVPTNSTFQYWGINFSVPYYYTGSNDTLIGHAFTGVGINGSLGFLTKQDYYSGGYHTLSQEEVQQVAFDWVAGHKDFTVDSYSAITIAGYSGTRINVTHTKDSGKIEYYRIVTFYDELNHTTRVIRMFWDTGSEDHPFSTDFDTMIQNASR